MTRNIQGRGAPGYHAHPAPYYAVIDCRCEPCRIADGDPDCARNDCDCPMHCGAEEET